MVGWVVVSLFGLGVVVGVGFCLVFVVLLGYVGCVCWLLLF